MIYDAFQGLGLLRRLFPGRCPGVAPGFIIAVFLAGCRSISDFTWWIRVRWIQRRAMGETKAWQEYL